MGSFSANYGSERQRHEDRGRPILHTLLNYYNEIGERLQSKMSKVAFILLNAASIGGYALIILANIADIKGWILFVIGVLYGGARLFFYVVKANQERRMRELDIQERKMHIAEAKKV